MRIAFLDLHPVSYAVDDLERRALGGTQGALCILASALASRGHAVTLVGAAGHDGETRMGVLHRAFATLAPGAVPAWDVLVDVNLAATPALCRRLLPPSGRVVLWMQNEAASASAAPLRDRREAAKFDRFVLVSHWQASDFVATFGLPAERIAVVQNPLSPAMASAPPGDRDRDLLVYASAPNRGLALFAEIWPRLRARRPTLRLEVLGGHDLAAFGEGADALRRVYEGVAAMAGVRWRPGVGKTELAATLGRAAMLCYPATFPETSCMVAIEAMAAGCLVSTCRIGALPETTAGFAMLSDPPGGPATIERFVERTLGLLDRRDADPAAMAGHLASQAAHARRLHDGRAFVERWERVLAETG